VAVAVDTLLVGVVALVVIFHLFLVSHRVVAHRLSLP
jgi:hypothetical protein